MSNERIFEASPEAKGQAKQLRLFALLAWLVAMAGQVYAILKLIHDDTMMWLIGVIVGILILSITGSWLWKKANRLDPASEKDKTRFFIQNQLGAILGVLAFLPCKSHNFQSPMSQWKYLFCPQFVYYQGLVGS